MKTSIQVWPTIKHRGRPGYSAGHFAMLAGAQEDPLHVAERIVARVEGEAIGVTAQEKLRDGENPSDVSEWISRQMGKASVARWERLCNSFDEVIAALESAPKTPVMKALVRQAKAARKQYGQVTAKVSL